MASNITPAQVGTSSRDQAIEWHLALHNVTALSPDRRADFEAWYAVSENGAAYDRVKGATLNLRQAINDPDVLEASKSVLTFVRAQRQKRRRVHGMAAAAVLAIFVGGSFRYANWELPGWPWQKPVERQYATAVGQRSSIVLEDGSTLTLDTNSLVNVVFGKERSIRLETGQAYFQVKKGDARPFVVYVSDRRILATGTAFDVRITPGGMEVALVEGQVNVAQVQKGQQEVIAATALSLRPGEQLRSKMGEAAIVARPASMQEVTSWLSGSHIFRDTKLKDAVREVNRYLDLPVVIMDESLSDISVNGVFATGHAGEFARMISQVNPIIFTRDTNGALLLKKKPQ